LLQAISDPVFRVSGITNKELRERLKKTGWGAKRTEKQLSARISRHFKLLRIHGIIRKLPNQHKYQMTLKGIKLCNALNAVLAASTENLMKIAA
jgi:transposase-like protein